MHWSSACNIQTETHSEASVEGAAIKTPQVREFRCPKISPPLAFSARLAASNPPMLSLSVSSMVLYKILIF